MAEDIKTTSEKAPSTTPKTTPDAPSLLSTINDPAILRGLDMETLGKLAAELRETIIQTVSRNGGHLAPSLGVIELTLALLKTFDPLREPIIWDVGHQAYAYKLLTGRRDGFASLRTMGGVSGFPKRCESPYDHFGVGHSSTSISAALGMAMARDLAGKEGNVVAVIGDGSMTAGLAFEGLNQAGHMGRKLVVILNDNEMSISPNVGALSSFLSRQLSQRWVRRMKQEVEQIVRYIPAVGDDLVDYMRKSEGSFKGFISPGGMLFEGFGFNYVGPVNGHSLPALCSSLNLVRDLDGPVLLHVMTKKGKGYAPAEENPTYFHGVGRFEPETGRAKKFINGTELPSYTKVFGSTICHLAERDERIVAITAAMPEGTGTDCFAARFPERFVDVGICEQHAVTFAAGLAAQGYKPVVAIYSTFLQRSYDQIVHDVCLQELDVTLCLDRGGLVGEDGPTHHGAFDLSFLRHIPNLLLMAPKDEAELQNMLYTAIDHPGPAAVRYPRGVGVGAELDPEPVLIPLGTGELLRDGKDAVIVALGSRVHPALEAAEELEADGLDVAVFNARFVRPLPDEELAELAERFPCMLLAEENALAGGFSSAVLECLSDRNLLSATRIRRVGLPDSFVEHGPQRELRKMLGLDKNGIKKAVAELVKE